MSVLRERNKSSFADRVLRADEILTLPGRGIVLLHCLDGQVWITEEGDVEDYVVPECAAWRSRGHGPIVVSGIAPSSRIRIANADAAAFDVMKPGVSIGADCAERLRRAAQREAASAVGHWLARGWRALAEMLKRIPAVAGSSATVRGDRA